MKLKPIISVVIPTYNGGKYISKTIDSVLSQTYKKIEIIIVDDGSTENLFKILKPYSKEIIYLYTKNMGPASARNTGIKICKGEYVSLLDHDDLWGPNNLKIKLEMLMKNKDSVMVYSYPELIDKDDLIIQHEKPNRFPNGYVFQDFLKRNWITTFSAVLMRRSVFDEIGNLDERQEVTTCDDYDFWLKIADKRKILFSNDNEVFYRIHNNNFVKNYHINMNAHFYVYERALKESISIGGIPKNKLKQIVSEHKYHKYKLFFSRFLYDKRDYNYAKRIIKKCIAIKPFVLINWILFLRCHIPERMINVIKRMLKSKLLLPD